MTKKALKPAELTPELVINLKAAGAIGVTVPQLLLARADEIIPATRKRR